MKDALFRFLDEGKSPWHVADKIKKALTAENYIPLNLADSFTVSYGGRYFVEKGGTVIAFKLPEKEPARLLFAACHVDSPTLKLKPKPSFSKGSNALIAAEIYGSPVLSSFLNREFGVAGKVYYDQDGIITSKLIDLSDYPLIIPHLAIHLDRECNEKGFGLNPENHLYLLASASLGDQFNLLESISKIFSLPPILSHDLVIYPLERARLIGFDHDLFASARIDNLGSAFSLLTGFTKGVPESESLGMAIFWNHEEIGSETAEGAGSTLFVEILERIRLSLSLSSDWVSRLRHSTFGLSIDEAHATHPNFPEKHDMRHGVRLGGGVVIKYNAKMRYATSGNLAAHIKRMCLTSGIPFQEFVSRNDIPCGSTIGPVQAAASGFELIDLGCPQLSMHGAREVGSLIDHAHLVNLVSRYFS
ncbi:M18 family aminopeptidase [Estrella lausannensis]|uniref:M18 family aminopeptidase n=1 Tax=Estrella lausannensis TaxID=483423 RepID=A0A0H5DTA1_9BACT|nr:M18 family aminopeptidase [Estrella lausannensis]CRX39059.1 Aminopeptidase [Estrella lausannensis]